MNKSLPQAIRKIMVDIAAQQTIPDLSGMSHENAHELYNQTVVSSVLRMLRFSPSKAKRLAAVHRGCCRERLERILKIEGELS